MNGTDIVLCSGMIGYKTFTCCSAIIKSPEHPKRDCLGPKGKRPADTPWRKAALRGTHSSHLEHLAGGAQRLASEKEDRDWKSSSRRFAEKRKLWAGPNNTPTQQCHLRL